MLIDGEKYACDACVRGHRVSSCTHSERQLQHINKKGRPVSQCSHCRGMRQKRSAHGKCGCGDKSEAQKHELSDIHACGCGTGQKCTCSLKKDQLGSIDGLNKPKSRSRANTASHGKPRLTTHTSDPPMTVFSNGHPKHPKHNNAGHETVPYKIPRPHSIHGQAQGVHSSVDNLPLLNGFNSPMPSFNAPLGNLQREQIVIRSAHGSPGFGPVRYDPYGGTLPTLDLAAFPAYNTSITSSPAGDDYPQFYQQFNNFESPANGTPPPPRSAPQDGWTSTDLPLDSGIQPIAYNIPASYTSYDQSHVSGPDMTNNTSSAELSEAEDYNLTKGVISPVLGDNSPFLPASRDHGYYSSTESLQASQAGYMSGLASITMDSFQPRPAYSPLDRHELSQTVTPDPTDHFTRHGMTVQEAQKLAHPGYTSAPSLIHNPMSGQPVMNVNTTIPVQDPVWAPAFIGADEDAGYVQPSPMSSIQSQNWL